MANRIQVRRDTAANWTSANPVLAAGEPALETDTGRRKTGDGTTAWTALPYVFDKTIADGIYTTPDVADAAYAPITGSANYLAPSQLDAANAANITTPTTATAGALNAAIGARTDPIAKITKALTRLSPSAAYPAVMTTPPTVTWAQALPSAIISPRLIPFNDTSSMTQMGILPADQSNARRSNALVDTTGGELNWSIRFEADTDVIDFLINCQATGTAWSYWLWVDDHPVNVAPVSPEGMTPSAGGDYTCHVTFASRAHRTFRLYLTGIRLRHIYLPPTAAIYPVPHPQVRAVLHGDSFTTNNGANGITTALELLTGWEVFNGGKSGTGYVNAGANTVFGSTTRMAQIVQINPDVAIILGSVNDDLQSAAAVGTAATALYTSYANQLPNCRLVVVGPQPTAFSASYVSGRLANRDAIKAAALAAPNVLAFIDPLGGGTLQSAWVTATAYNVGDMVTSRGGVYVCQIGHTSTGSGGPDGSPSWSGYWKLSSWYTGTGNFGATTGDGNRDLYLRNDGTPAVHPTTAFNAGEGGSRYWAWRIASELQKALIQ